MIDKFIYKFFSLLDEMFSWLETYSVKFTSWLWNSRVKLLHKKRKTKQNVVQIFFISKKLFINFFGFLSFTIFGWFYY